MEKEDALFAVPNHAALGGQDGLFAAAAEGLAHDLFRQAVTVHGGRVDEVDALVEGGADGRDGLGLVGSPHIQPPMAQVPRATADTSISAEPSFRYCMGKRGKIGTRA